jgi:bifunctional non-homologous end joining protein LigD
MTGKSTTAKKISAAKSTTAKKISTAKLATGKKTSARKSPARKNLGKKTVSRPASARKVAKPSAGTLALYNAKRDFKRTAEPEGKVLPHAGTTALRFVIQKHAASHLHFDFRLELDGVMKSWAVPKGPNYDPTVKRLAMEVEDHPIEYNTFEGTIPKGEYGGGTVMIWDRGTYGPESGGGEDALRRGYARGDLKITMNGDRMRGGWVLVRTRRDDRGRAQWLLIKHRDEYAREGFDVVGEEMTSVVSGRSMEQIAKGDDVWHSNRRARR